MDETHNISFLPSQNQEEKNETAMDKYGEKRAMGTKSLFEVVFNSFCWLERSYSQTPGAHYVWLQWLWRTVEDQQM